MRPVRVFCVCLTRWAGLSGVAAGFGWRCARCWALCISPWLVQSCRSLLSSAESQSVCGSRSYVALRRSSWPERDGGARSPRWWIGGAAGEWTGDEGRFHLSVRYLLALLFAVVRGEGPGDGNIQSFVPPTAGTASAGGQTTSSVELHTNSDVKKSFIISPAQLFPFCFWFSLLIAAGFSLFTSKTKLKPVQENYKCLQDTKHR